MFSHVGLCGLVVLYAMLGGLTFEKIESAEERESKVKGKVKGVTQTRFHSLGRVFAIAESLRATQEPPGRLRFTAGEVNLLELMSFCLLG